jgi:hypothetical protein
LRFIELGGTPRCHMPFDSLVKWLCCTHNTVREGGILYLPFHLFAF